MNMQYNDSTNLSLLCFDPLVYFERRRAGGYDTWCNPNFLPTRYRLHKLTSSSLRRCSTDTNSSSCGHVGVSSLYKIVVFDIKDVADNLGEYKSQNITGEWDRPRD
jgi:hypothetical protein